MKSVSFWGPAIFWAVLALLPAFPALADSFTGGRMTVYVPSGWSVMYKADVNQIVLTVPDDSFSIGIMVRDLAGQTVLETAEELAFSFGGPPPEKPPDGRYYTVNANISGAASRIMVMGDDKKVLTYVESGNPARFETEANLVFSSLNSSDPGEQALFEAHIGL